jgi:hypothetical protein
MLEVNGEEADDEFEDGESRDRLFEEYIREIDQIPPIEQRENFNTELPTEHLVSPEYYCSILHFIFEFIFSIWVIWIGCPV